MSSRIGTAPTNLTAITDRTQMLTHHLLDSLSVAPFVQGSTVADVGTGAGFPGLPLAVLAPQRRFALVDSNGKKQRFVAHAARTLGLANVEALHARVEEGAAGAALRHGRGAGRSQPCRNCSSGSRRCAVRARGCWP